MARGRRTRLTKPVKKLLLEGIENGLFVEEACERAGIAKSTYYNWMKQARDGKARPELMEFLDAVRAKEIEAEEKALAAIRKCGQGYEAVTVKEKSETKDDGNTVVVETTKTTQYIIDWRAAHAWLERRFPERWGRKMQVKQEGGGAGAGGDGMKMLIIDASREP